MKFIGSVTKYYPFLDSEGRKKIQLLLEEADDYSNFTDRLVKWVISEEVSDDVAFISLKQAIQAANLNGLEIYERYGNYEPIKALFNHIMAYLGDRDAWNVAIETVDNVLKTHFDDWLAIEMLTIKGDLLARINARESLGTMQKALTLLRGQEKLQYFAQDVYYFTALSYAFLNDYAQCRVHAEKAIKLANEANDYYFEAWGCVLGRIGHPNRIEELEYTSRALDLFESLGNHWGQSAALNNMGFAYVAIGEYDKAIQCFLRSADKQKITGVTEPLAYINLAGLYGNIGDCEKALQYAEMALEYSKLRGAKESAAYNEMARALVLNGRLDEAFDYLETGGELAFESGSKRSLAKYYLVRGLYDREKGELQSALLSLQRALRIANEIGNYNHSIRILLHIADVELAQFSVDNDRKYINASKLTLARIEQIANEQNLPGPLVQVALLKAELQTIQQQKDAARQTLEKAFELCEKMNLESLQGIISKRLQEFDIDEPYSKVLGRFRERVRTVAVPGSTTQTISFDIFGCIVIIKDAGLEIYSKYVDERLISDPSLVAGLISAVSSFTQELRADTSGQLQSIVHQDIAVLLEYGKYTTCALLADKDTYNARVLLRLFLESFEDRFSRNLEKFDGKVLDFGNADDLFSEILAKSD